jgi:N-acetylmuramoyl-L-alanine amidase
MPLINTERGIFVKYPDWKTGFLDLAHRLVKTDYVYAQEGRKTIEQIITRFAPDSDNNNTAGYIDSVVSTMNKWIGSSTEVIPKVTLKIALAAGHHNSDGGSQVEADITGPLCHFYATAFRELGCDVRVITPNDGLGQYPGGLQDVAQKVVDWANTGWQADLFLECHTQGVGDTSVRGAFAIYPDWGSDVDKTVRDDLGPLIVKAISAATGIPVWSRGTMSEKATGVGISGYRLGIFLRTAPIASKTTRLIVEHGAHTNPQDLTLLQNPTIQQRIAKAAAGAILSYLGGTSKVATNNQGPKPAVDPTMLMNGFAVGHGFLDYFNKYGGVRIFGLPITNEENNPKTGLTEQTFERMTLEYDPKADPDWQVRGKDIGRFYLSNRGF